VGQMDVCHADAVLRLTSVQGKIVILITTNHHHHHHHHHHHCALTFD
jgi:hypothetical protein